MKLEQIQLPVTNHLYNDYVTNSEKIAPFFEYTLHADAFERRLQYLENQTYKFTELADVIERYMGQFHLTEAVQTNIQLLREGAFAVVGGQQAGILTGPLYSVHKAVTVILLAKQQSEQLNRPIVPLFWIAGEDHDIEEINHTYTVENYRLKKRAYSIRSRKKTMASTTHYDHAEMKRTIEQIFADFGETAYTASLLKEVLEQVEKNNTYTQLFTALMNHIFGKHGLLMIDAADPYFRKFESEYFVRLIENSEKIASLVTANEQKLEEAGYSKAIFATESNANLFYVKDEERHLLEWDGEFAKNNVAQVKFTKEQLLKIALNSPEHFSNNVVTRPLMQEMTIPVLAFVGGPGELAYWATLKPAFEQLNLKMPIFKPRAHITFVTRKVQALLAQHNISLLSAFNGEMMEQLKAFIESVQDTASLNIVKQMEQQLSLQYEQLKEQLKIVDVKMNPLLEKNEQFHQQQLQFLTSKIREQITNKHAVKINQFNEIQLEITPNGFQERTYNPYMYMNEYGPSLIDDMLQVDLTFEPKHQVLYL